MPQAAPLLMGIGAATGAVASIASAREQKKAGKLQQQQADRQAATERRRIVRESRIRRAQTINSAAQTGTSGSSGAVSAAGAIGSEAAFNTGQSFMQQELSQRISDRLQRSANFQTLGNVASAVQSGASVFL